MFGSLRAVAFAASAILTFGSASPAIAADVGQLSVNMAAVPAAVTPVASTPVVSPVASTPAGAASIVTAGVTPVQAPVAPIAPGQATQVPFAQGPTVSAPASDKPASSLSELVDAHSGTETQSEDQECIAAAVYFEARGEPIEGQLAVAEVVLNRAASGKYPSSICAVVKQPAQFSFVRKGRIPPIAKATDAWRKAVAVAHVAAKHLAKQISSSVLWYHASYVRPDWGRRLTRVAQIGAHIFYN